MEAAKFLAEFQDHLAPKLDTYEQAIYLYLIRHSRLIDIDEVVVGFKSARKQMAFGVGEKGKPPSEGTCYEKVQSLQSKKIIAILGTERNGHRIHAYLPHEIDGLIPANLDEDLRSVEDIDFFSSQENRQRILIRERQRCFYCQAQLTKDNYVVEHVTSRPQGDNSYRNVVAACRQCNNRKGALEASDFLRILYRDGLLNQVELENGLSQLGRLRSGELKP